MNKIKLFIASSLLILPLFYMSSVVVHAQDNPEKIFGACDQSQVPTAGDPPVCQDETNTEDPVVRIINISAGLIALAVGIGAVIMIILGSFKFVTSGGIAGGQRAGDPSSVADAKRMISYSLIALVVVALAWALIRVATDRFIN